jgi:hypothetical protein
LQWQVSECNSHSSQRANHCSWLPIHTHCDTLRSYAHKTLCRIAATAQAAACLTNHVSRLGQLVRGALWWKETSTHRHRQRQDREQAAGGRQQHSRRAAVRASPAERLRKQLPTSRLPLRQPAKPHTTDCRHSEGEETHREAQECAHCAAAGGAGLTRLCEKASTATVGGGKPHTFPSNSSH